METYQIHHTTLDVLLIEDKSQDRSGPGFLAGALGAGAPAGGQSSEKSVRQIQLGYQVVLAQASVRHLESLALQGIEAQICGCPVREAARAALGTVADFLKANPSTSLRRILFMQYTREGYDAFCDELKSLARELSASSGA